MTIEELRQALFQIDNQDMTVAELRALLFAVTDQGATVGRMTLLEIEREIKNV